jgi:cytochrome c553
LKELGITGKPDKITFPAGDQRAAGVLTTSMFRSRYVATPSNLNRRYAQAIYRIFLCEELTPVALPNTDLEAAYKKKLSAMISFLQNLPASKPNDPQPHPSPGMGMEMNMLLGDPHATDPTCVSCHERLDPMAATFGTPGGQTFPEKAFPGAFVRRVFGEKIETPAAGIYELATILTNHPQYQDCQVKHFWDWFIGADAPQSAETHARWLTKFKEGTGVRDFIEWIAVQPEFRRDRTYDLEANLHDPTGFLQVEPILERCNGCHGFHGIDFTQRPWGGSRESDARWLIEFRRHLDPGAPVADAMPPNRDEWSATDLEKLRQWMNQATPWDDGGFP